MSFAPSVQWQMRVLRGSIECYRSHRTTSTILAWGSASSNGKSIGHLCYCCFPSAFSFFLPIQPPPSSILVTHPRMSIDSSLLLPFLQSDLLDASKFKGQNPLPSLLRLYLCLHLPSLIKTDSIQPSCTTTCPLFSFFPSSGTPLTHLLCK